MCGRGMGWVMGAATDGVVVSFDGVRSRIVVLSAGKSSCNGEILLSRLAIRRRRAAALF